jgi:hypothetical protein
VALSGAIPFPSVRIMIRLYLVACISVPLIVSLSFVSEAAPPKKKTKGAQAKTLSVGDEVIFKLLGDETKGKEKLDRVAVIRNQSLMLPVLVQDVNPADTRANYEIITRYIDALNAADRVGLDKLIQRGGVMPVASGTRLVVLEIFRISPSSPSFGRWVHYGNIPASRPDGTCRVRVVDGPNKGKICEVPLRNLAEASKEAKGEAEKE